MQSHATFAKQEDVTCDTSTHHRKNLSKTFPAITIFPGGKLNQDTPIKSWQRANLSNLGRIMQKQYCFIGEDSKITLDWEGTSGGATGGNGGY